MSKKNGQKAKTPRRYKAYKPQYAIDIYRWVLGGLSDKQIAMNLGVSHGTVSQWKRRYASVRYAFWRGEKDKAAGKETDWEEYVKGRLPLRLQKVWEEMCVLEKEPTGYAKAKALLRVKPRRLQQQMLVYAVLSNGFNLSRALHRLGIPRRTLMMWMETDPQFTDLLHEVHEIKKDFFEEGLMKLIQAGDSPATIFANRTQNRDRGYAEKTEVVHSGEVVQWTVPIGELGLSNEVLREVLTALKTKTLPEKTPPKLIEAQVIDGDGNGQFHENTSAEKKVQKAARGSRQHGQEVRGEGVGAEAGEDLPGAAAGNPRRSRSGKAGIQSL